MSFDPITNAGVKALQGQVNTVQTQTTALTTKLAQIESALASLNTAQASSRKPLRVTEYTSGAGTHTFLPESTHQYITLVGAGGAGGAGYLSGSQHIQNGGGSAGYELRLRMALTATAAYQVGAGGGTSGAQGGRTVLGAIAVSGGAGGSSDRSYTPPPQVGTGGVETGEAGTFAKGGNSTMGIGGQCYGLYGSIPLGYATGYGAGGGGSYGPGGFSPGTGGYIRIEEY